MSTADHFELHADPGRLEALADTQSGYRARFDGILDQLVRLAEGTGAGWNGAGSSGYAAARLRHTVQFQEVQAAFARLADVTAEAARDWRAVCDHAEGKFE